MHAHSIKPGDGNQVRVSTQLLYLLIKFNNNTNSNIRLQLPVLSSAGPSVLALLVGTADAVDEIRKWCVCVADSRISAINVTANAP